MKYVMALLLLMAVPGYAQEVTISVTDFGKGMTPALPPYRNVPGDIVLSQNFLSTSPGGRQLRFGYSRVDTNSIAASDSGIQSIVIFVPTQDSAQVIYTAGAYWFGNVAGSPRTAIWDPGFEWKTYLTAARQVRPYNGGDSITMSGDSVVGYGTRFLRDLQVGDSLITAGEREKIAYIVSDTKFKTDSTFDVGGTVSSFNFIRNYSLSATDPYMLQSGDLVYTGTTDDPPQVIYVKDDTLRIRPMGIVDSFYIDAIYTKYPPTQEAWDSLDKYGGRRSWDTTAADKEYYKEFQLVSRRKPGQWLRNQWFESVNENPEAYYVRIGYEDKTPFYQISGNSDTAIYLMTWYVDTTVLDPSATDSVVTDSAYSAGDTFLTSAAFTEPDDYWINAICSLHSNSACAGSTFTVTDYDSTADSISFASFGCTPSSSDSFTITKSPLEWNDSIFFGKGQDVLDTVRDADAEGQWGYVYAATGFARTVVTDASTDTVMIRGRGAMFYTVDASFPIDSTEIYKAMHFIHLTGDDIDFPAYIDEASKLLQEYTIRRRLDEPLQQADLENGDTIRSQRSVWTCGFNKYYSTYDEAVDHCFNRTISQLIEYNITTTRTDQLTKEAEAIGNAFFPIRYLSHSGDTVFFITAVGTDLTDESEVSTSNWEIVRVGLPYWSGMEEWNTPPQLVAWGDTASPSLLSFSGINDPWNWSVNNDVLVGNDPASPIMHVLGYDDQLVIWKPSSMVGYDGSQFRELSQTDGIVGTKAAVGLTKELYWRDVDGVKKMQRRDFSGYSIQKISDAMDPVFNSWNAVQFGSDVVPVTLDATKRDQTVLTYNQRDRHLYMFTDQTGCFTYDIERDIWDGYHTIAATDALWTTIRDTSRILFGSPDSSIVYALDYAWNDDGAKIDGDLKGAKFFLTDENGFPVESRFDQVWFVSRAASGTFDSAYILIIGSNQTDTLDLDYTGEATPTFKRDFFYSQLGNRSTFWNWEIKVYGASSASIFQPQNLVMQFIPEMRDN